MISVSSLRSRLVGAVFLAILPGLVLVYYTSAWTGACVGLFAVLAAYYGGEKLIVRPVRILSRAASQFAAGDFSIRTGLTDEKGELGELDRTFDKMAEVVQHQVLEREASEKRLLARSLQQTVVSALGQFALASKDLTALLNQAAMMVTQTLEVEYCQILEMQSDNKSLLLRAGVGWKTGLVGKWITIADGRTQCGYTLRAGEPVVTHDLVSEQRFGGSPLLVQHGVIAGISVAISGQGQAFGVLGAHTTHPRRFTEDEVHFLMAVGTVLAMAVARTRALAEMEKLAGFAQLNPNPAMELTPEGQVNYSNPAAARLAEAAGLPDVKSLLPSDIKKLVKDCLAQRRSNLRHQTEVAARTLSWSLHPVNSSNVVHAYVEDITGRLSLEAQLRQSQKMESVGQLAAGVAHDFNNMLTIIQGHAGMLLAKSELPPSMGDSTQAIYFAAERAAGLTRQLLMFSRKSIIQRKLLDLRDVVSNMSKMLHRLLGETIVLDFLPPAQLPLVKADLGMVEQVIMNLCVNARDAMPSGGKLRIATEQAAITEEYAGARPEARPGHFVCLRVTDTGCGMDEATRARIFEPFFTTKEVGKGTGLGLATVYGIVKQHDGWIDVSSAPGKGATFAIYFPAGSDAVVEAETGTKTVLEVPGGDETILVVEDEPVLRELAEVILTDGGYKVLQASSGVEAMKVWEKHRDDIDLVLTDMVMPEGMSGMDLAQRLHVINPRIKIVFASGYSMDDLDTTFIRKGYAAFLQKPYTHVSLRKAVRYCLDSN